MNNNENNKTKEKKNAGLTDVQTEFSEVYNIILSHRKKVASAINNESLTMI